MVDGIDSMFGERVLDGCLVENVELGYRPGREDLDVFCVQLMARRYDIFVTDTPP